MPGETQIRDAELADLEAIFAIYNHEVLNTTSTFDTVPRELPGDRDWLTERDTGRHPVLVAESAEAGVVGWGSLSPWSVRGAYARTAEESIYVDRSWRGHGTGRALLSALIERGRAAGLGVLLARIAGDNPTSIALHRSLGFETIGTQRRSGEKFGNIIDVELMDLHLDR
jgi:phosphinothricin acetyltransferase